MGVAFGVVLPVAGCSPGGGAVEECEETLESLSLSVDGVSGADFECHRSFGNDWEKGTVTVAATTQDELVGVMEDVLRTYAASPDLDDASGPSVYFTSEDGGLGAGPGDVGFNGTPSMAQIREHYGIEP